MLRFAITQPAVIEAIPEVRFEHLIKNTQFEDYYNSDKDYTIIGGIDKLVDLYTNIRTENVYESEYFDLYKYWSHYSTKPLRKTLNKIFAEILKTNMIIKPNPVLIGSTNLNEGYFQIFDF